MGRGHREAFQAQALQVERDCLLHVLFDFFACFAGLDAAFQVGGIPRVSGVSLFNDHEVFF
jgi:hypothetical protein